MTTCVGKSCSFSLPLGPFVKCYQLMYLVISLFVLLGQDMGSDSRKRRDVTTWRVAKLRYQGVENKPLICIAV